MIEQGQRVIAEWLKEMGLELKPEKTKITHTLHSDNPGFDFLGFNVRQYEVGKYHTGKNGHGKPPENLYLEIGEFPKIGKKCLKIGHNMGKAEVRSPRVNR